jgi:hypothetical protein
MIEHTYMDKLVIPGLGSHIGKDRMNASMVENMEKDRFNTSESGSFLKPLKSVN